MAASLEQFVAELKIDIEKFEAAYRAKHEKNPEHYPLALTEDNEGLWFEFFITYCQTGEV